MSTLVRLDERCDIEPEPSDEKARCSKICSDQQLGQGGKRALRLLCPVGK
jgi:hypothetical protein